MNKRRHGLASESGQGIIEYVLILVVVIGLAMLLMNKFFKPMQRWTDHYLGGYVVCLLDQGKLPSLGGDGKLEDCTYEDQFAGSDAAGNKKGNTNSSGEKNNNSDKSSGSENRRKSDSNQKSSGGNLQSTDGGRQQRVRVGGTDGGGSSKDSKTTVAGAESKEAKSQGNFRIVNTGAGGRVEQGRTQSVQGLSGLLAAERDKIKKREDKVQKAIASASEESGGSGKKKFEFKPSTKRVMAQDFEMDEWSIGKLLRILLILIIVIALALFIGGQVVQISKGAEK